MSCVFLVALAATAAAGDLARGTEPLSCGVKSLSEVEMDEDYDTALLDMRLLQKRAEKRQPADLAIAEAATTNIADQNETLAAASSAKNESSAVEEAAGGKAKEAAEEASLVSYDQNGHVCLLCGKPLPERLGGKIYTEHREDCGGHSSKTGPRADVMDKPALEFTQLRTKAGKESNGFCELNFAKSCADAITNQDYLYWAKSLDLQHSEMQESAKWDARYCHLNGFLKPELVALQANFTGLRSKARELCDTKYRSHGIEKLTFKDMMKRARYDDPNAPSQESAEILAAWNCAMGDLGCDMAMCGYSFCEKADGTLGLYGECAGWDPVKGMAA